MPTEIREHSFDTGTVTINYAEGPPSGPPLVLLHGGSGRWQNYEGIIPDLAARFLCWSKMNIRSELSLEGRRIAREC